MCCTTLRVAPTPTACPPTASGQVARLHPWIGFARCAPFGRFKYTSQPPEEFVQVITSAITLLYSLTGVSWRTASSMRTRSASLQLERLDGRQRRRIQGHMGFVGSFVGQPGGGDAAPGARGQLQRPRRAMQQLAAAPCSGRTNRCALRLATRAFFVASHASSLFFLWFPACAAYE